MDAHTSPVARRNGATTVTPMPSAEVPQNLPSSLTSFIGRRRELTELREALATTRLLTLTGPGGCGKTRLGLQCASGVVDRFPGGVWWVDLAPLAEERLVATTVAEALDVRPLPGFTELQAISAYLAARRALIVLDNCEHLLEACAEVVEPLLQSCPDVIFVATSRAPLGVAGETDWRVPPLSLPTEEGEGLADSDAAALFVERATKVSPGFALSDENADSVARLCRDLDGLPLAIELAAARLRMLSTEQIARGLADRFRLLAGGPRTALERHQTLRASVDWSHELLSADEQRLLRRLGVFAGGFTLDAAEGTCAGAGLANEQILDLLGSLVEQSMVIAEHRGPTTRYRLLETVREYALERLAEAGEEVALRTRQRDHFLSVAEEAAPHLETDRQREWFEVLDSEAANMAVAIEHALKTEPPLALRFCLALRGWWRARGRSSEAELAHSRSLDACGNREPALRARATESRADLSLWVGDFAAADAYATEALALAEEVGDKGTAALARRDLGSAMGFTDPTTARGELARAAELAQAAGDDRALVLSKQALVLTYLFQDEHAQASRANEEVAALAERLGDPLQIARRWLFVALPAHFDGRFAEARAAVARLRGAVADTGEPVIEAMADVVEGLADAWQGEPRRPLERLPGRLERTVRLGAGNPVPLLLLAIGFAELSAGRPERAREQLEGLVTLMEGRGAATKTWALCLLAEALRLLADTGAETTALEAQASGERVGNRLHQTRARLTLGRLAASRAEWTDAQQHALAHLDACVEGGHATYIPGCLDALAEVATGMGAEEDAVRLFAAAERARAEIAIVRVPPEESHWAAIDGQLREALGPDAHEAARGEGAALSIEDALEWARRARGPRRRPESGWASLTPTEARVAELVAEGLSNPQVGERMFISRSTVKTHLGHIFRKLDVRNRTELTARAGARNDASRTESNSRR